MNYSFKNIFPFFLVCFNLLDIVTFSTPLSNQPSDSAKVKKQETTHTYYNADGNITSVKHYDSNDSLLSFTINKYNNKSLLSESFSYFSNGKQKTKNKVVYDKDDSLKIYEELVVYLETGGISSSTSNYFDEKGLLTRTVNCRYEFETDNKIQCDTSELKQTRSEDGLTSETLNNYKYFGVKSQLKIITVRDNIKHIEETSTYFNDSLSGKTTVEYDGAGAIIKTCDYTPNGILMYYTDFSENEAGNITTSMSYDQNKKLTDKTIVIRDKHNNPLKILAYRGKETMTYREEYKYKYTKKDKYSEVELVKYY